MKELLESILHCLSDEELHKEVIIKDENDDLGKLFSKDITIIETGELKKIYIAPLGDIKDYSSKSHLVYRNSKHEIVIKPKKIREFLNLTT